MKAGEAIYHEIRELCTVVMRDGDKFYEEGNKAAGTRARVALDTLANLKVQWRKETK